MATLSKYGRLLNHDKISSSAGAPKSVSTLIAKSYSNMYQENRRRPLRKYQRTNTLDFSIDGEVDPVEIAMPSTDGFQQEILKFSKVNNWNSILQAAAYKLLTDVSDPKVVSSLTRIIEDFSGQPKPNLSRIKQIPSRQKIWKPVFDLAVDILKDLSLVYDPGVARSPGFLINTWRTWEDLLTLSVKLGFKSSKINSQKGFTLGVRNKPLYQDVSLKVFPDCYIHSNNTMPNFIIDAKYKGNAERGPLRISEADVYECLAFSKATGCNTIILAYPAQPTNPIQLTGSCTVFEKIEIDALKIFGVQIVVKGISQKNGLQSFSKNLSNNIIQLLT